MLQHRRSLSMSFAWLHTMTYIQIYIYNITYTVIIYICLCFLFFFNIDMFADLELDNSWASLFLPDGRLSHLISEVLSSAKSHSTGVKGWDQGIVATRVQKTMRVLLGSPRTHAILYQFGTSVYHEGLSPSKCFNGSQTTYTVCCKWIWPISIRTPWNPSWRCCPVTILLAHFTRKYDKIWICICWGCR